MISEDEVKLVIHLKFPMHMHKQYPQGKPVDLED
jgi:hypothetical protein